MGGHKDLITAGLTLGALADAEAKAKGKMSAIIATESGSAVSFTAADAAPVADLTAAIVPVQSGSGDPSPTNIRLISGWTECKVTRAGKNVLHNYPARTSSDITFEYDNAQNCYRIYGTPINTFVSSYCIGGGAVFIETNLLPSVEYVFSMTGDVPAVIKKIQLEVLYDDNTSDLFLAGVPFTLQKESTRQRVRWYDNNNVGPEFNSANTYDIKLYPQLELGSAATAYEPYRGDIYTVAFGSAGTVYGGTLDVTTGKLTVDKAKIHVSASDFVSWFPQYKQAYTGAIVTGAKVDLDAASYICDMFKPVAVNKRNENIGNFACLVTSATCVACSSSAESLEDFKSLIPNGIDIVYELATPIVYHLTPVEIRTLVGQNTIWADTGDVMVKYATTDTKAFIDKYIAERRNG